MKKTLIVAAIIVMSLMTVSCKNAGKCADKNGENTECCCGGHENGECTKAEGEKCDKCKEAEAHKCKHEDGKCKEGACKSEGGCKGEGNCGHK